MDGWMDWGRGDNYITFHRTTYLNGKHNNTYSTTQFQNVLVCDHKMQSPIQSEKQNKIAFFKEVRKLGVTRQTY